MSHQKVAFVGELLLRLSAPEGLLLRQSQGLQLHVGGAEANVAVALAHWGIPTAFLSALPANDLGDLIVEHLRKYGVATDAVIRQGERVGLYFYEAGAGLRAGKVIYDRKGSAFAQAAPQEYSSEIFRNASWLHFTGITPVVSERAAQTLLWAIKHCRNRTAKISIDLNFRKSLWKPAEHRPVFEAVFPHVDIVMADLTSLAHMANIAVNCEDFTDDPVIYHYAANQFFDKYPHASLMIFSVRQTVSSRAFNIQYIVCDRQNCIKSDVFKVEDATERIGAGDAATAAAIYALLKGFSYEKIANMAAAASALKHFVKGDHLTASIEEVMEMATGKMSFSVKR